MNGDLFSGFEAAFSGMAAERRRMQVIASNIANANTVSASGPYVRKSLVFEEVLGAAGGSDDRATGVRAVRVFDDTTTEHPRVHEPGHPAADADGYVRLPNVNIMFELVDMMVARRAYSANLTAFQAWRSMLRNAVSHISAR